MNSNTRARSKASATTLPRIAPAWTWKQLLLRRSPLLQLRKLAPFDNDLKVGFLDRLRGHDQTQSHTMDALTLHAGGTLSVVGESYRQETLKHVAEAATGPEPYLAELKGRTRAFARKPDVIWFRAALMREPTNPRDPNAIAVHATGIGLVGYLDRETALDYRPVFDELERLGYAVGACPAMLTGGRDGLSWGVTLCVSSPEAVIGDLRAS